MNKRNATVVILATVLMIGSVVGILVIGQVINPPTVPVVVAVVDIPAGTVLTQDLVAVDNVQMNPKVLSAMIRESELANFIGGAVIQPVSRYEPLLKSAVSADGNSASARRVALALSDPKLVAMVVPVSQETSPDAIVEGDYVDLGFGAGSNTAFGKRLSTVSTEEPFAPSLGGLIQQPSPIPLEATVEATSTPTPEPLLVLPVAKTIVSHAKVLSVIREERTVTTGGQIVGQGEPRTAVVKGKIIGIVVAIPREAQELIQFAIDNGVVRVSVLSAEAASSDVSLGMTWNDLVALVRMDREEALAAGLPAEVIGPGAFAVEATRNAATQAVLNQTLTAIAPTTTESPPIESTPVLTPTHKP